MAAAAACGRLMRTCMHAAHAASFMRYARKVILACLVRMHAQEHVKREKQIMAECDCPFMVNLVTSFKDGQHLYMLMECVMGGELFTYLQVTKSNPLEKPLEAQNTLAQ